MRDLAKGLWAVRADAALLEARVLCGEVGRTLASVKMGGQVTGRFDCELLDPEASSAMAEALARFAG